ncbi:MAG TPA: dienelactone hydrolase family protein [Stellaceae bacterium]|nr:dienelactone hydrolase family protein [Stellaceae bacterium]
MVGNIARVFLSAALLAGAAVASARADVTGWAVTLETQKRDGGTEQIPATVLKPDGSGPFPAIVMLHDCSGLGARSSGAPRRWADFLTQMGYVVILPDSFSTRGFPEGVCTAPLDTPVEQMRRTYPIQRMYDAYAALAYLRAQPFVDGAHVGVMGGSHGGSSTLEAMVEPATAQGLLVAEKRKGFAAGIALYPGCGDRYGLWSVKRELGDHGPVLAYDGLYRPIGPLLILVGEKDDWTPARDCQALAERSHEAGLTVDIVVYAGARHSFDSAARVYFNPNRRNLNAPDRHGATTGGDPAAWADSKERIAAFFARTLKGKAD